LRVRHAWKFPTCNQRFASAAHSIAMNGSFIVKCTSGLPDFSWHMIPKLEKCTKWTQIVPNGHKISQKSIKYVFQMAIKYFNFFPSKALQNLTELGFLVWKQTIWQP
jgi:hypothetical protein